MNKPDAHVYLVSTYTFARGWLDSLELSSYGVEVTRAMARAPQLRLLRRLTMHDNRFEEPGEYHAGDDIPEGANYPQLYPLVRCPFLGNVKVLTIGETMTPEEDDDAEDGGFSCHTEGDGVVGIIKRMPKLEELHLLCHHVDAEQLYSLRTLDNLRVLTHYHDTSYPLARLAKNPALGKLTHLLCHPHALDDEDAYIRQPGLRAVARSTGLKSLTHLRLRLSDMGDKGVDEVIASGLLRRLKVLDLRHGCITDAGAQALAAGADLKNLELLDLTNNNLTDAGIQALRATGAKVKADGQWHGAGDDWGGDHREYLYAGDIE